MQQIGPDAATGSSYRATTGEAACPDWRHQDWLLSAFGATEQAGVARYRRFVAEGIGQPVSWEHLKHQLVDGLMEAGLRVHLANTAAIVQYDGLK